MLPDGFARWAGNERARLTIQRACSGVVERDGEKMRRRRFSLLMLLLTLSATDVVRAESLKDFTGTWEMRLGERNLFVLHLETSNGSIAGTIERPAKLSGTNGAYANIGGGVRRDSITHAELKEGVLHLTVQNANDPKDEDKYAMTVKGDTASLIWDDLPPGIVVAPLIFMRGDAAAKVATDWEPNRLYCLADSDIPNVEMKAIFDDDQRVRMQQKADGKDVSRTDAERREQVRKLLAFGALHTGKDYEEAAVVFQHGDSPSDYLLAHTLAMIAVSKGDSTAIWIASATLDRFLQEIGQKQIFGTQYSPYGEHGWTQEPYDRGLISDALRQQLAVPSQALQAEQLKQYQSQK